MTPLEDPRDAQMPAATVDAMERRLLEAFAAHHADPSRIASRAPVAVTAGHSWRRWVAAAAAVAIVAGTVEGWRVLRGGGPVAGTATPAPAPSVAAPSAAAPATPSTAQPASIDVVTNRATVPPPTARKPARRTPPAPQSNAFVALPGAAGMPQFESGTIVRVDLPVASLPGYGVDISRAAGDGAVAADLLVGQDGQARAIRLVTSRNASSSSAISRSQQ